MYNVCTRLNRTKETDSLFSELIVMGTPEDLTATGRGFIFQKQTDRAMQFLLANEKKHGSLLIVNSGLMRGYSAKGDFKKAIELFSISLEL